MWKEKHGKRTENHQISQNSPIRPPKSVEIDAKG
jgi:hypothetical protein